MYVGVVPVELLESECVVVAVDIFLRFQVVNKTMVDAFGDDVIPEVKEIFGNKTEMIRSELFELGPRHIPQIQSVKVVISTGIVQVVTINTIVQDVNEMAKTESRPFDALGNIAMGSDEIPFVGFGVEGFQVVVGDKHAIPTQCHHLAIVLKEVAVEIAAVIHRFIQADGRIAFEFEDIPESVDVVQGIFSDGKKGCFSIFKYAQVGFFVQVLEDGFSNGIGLVGCEFLGDDGRIGEQIHQCNEQMHSDMSAIFLQWWCF